MHTRRFTGFPYCRVEYGLSLKEHEFHINKVQQGSKASLSLPSLPSFLVSLAGPFPNKPPLTVPWYHIEANKSSRQILFPRKLRPIDLRQWFYYSACSAGSLSHHDQAFKERNRRASSKLELVGVRVALGKRGDNHRKSLLGFGKRSGPSLAGFDSAPYCKKDPVYVLGIVAIRPS